jgi:hypothetical protein
MSTSIVRSKGAALAKPGAAGRRLDSQIERAQQIFNEGMARVTSQYHARLQQIVADFTAPHDEPAPVADAAPALTQ